MKYVLFIIFLSVVVGYLFVGGFGSQNFEGLETSETYNIDTTITPTINVKESLQLETLKFKKNPSCEDKKIALNLLLDTSGSMGYQIPGTGLTRIHKLREALTSFADILKEDKDIIGVQEFSGPDNFQGQPAQVVLDFGEYDKVFFLSKIPSLEPHNFTFTGAGFELANSEITEARANFTDPDFKWILLFISDGIPTTPDGRVLTDLQSLKNRVEEIKQSGIIEKIISVGLDLNTLSGGPTGQPDPLLMSIAKDLMGSFASTPQDFYDSVTSEQLKSVLEEIGRSLC